MPHPRTLLLPAPPEPFSGWTNVDEVPGELGGTLLVLYRSVLLWADTPADERGTLFAGGSAEEPSAPPDRASLPRELAEAFRALHAMRTEPGRVRPALVSRACDAVSAWAEREGHTGTALAWARAAASAYPPNAAAAYRVGIMARRRADYATAEAWLQHAGSMARRHGDWYGFVLSLNSLGNLHVQHGEFGQARASLAKALAAARRPRGRVEGGRKRLRVREGCVLHDLMTVSINMGEFSRAERYAAEAFERMRAGHRRLPRLAHDVAVLWMERGYFGRALAVFDAVLPHFHTRLECLLVCCNLARCAGAERRAEVYTRAAGRVKGLVPDAETSSVPAVIFTNLARGAAGLRLWEDAERAALLAAEAAEARQEADQLAAVPSLLESIRLHRYADVLPEPASPLEERIARSLAVGLVEALTALRAGD
jgi:tetratricopeptide (TPR) repeat protein